MKHQWTLSTHVSDRQRSVFSQSRLSPAVPPAAGRPAQTQSVADAKSQGCLSCHAGIEPMHASPAVKLGCIDCHGGNANTRVKEEAHVQPEQRPLQNQRESPRTYGFLEESPEFIRFMNPGDLRVARRPAAAVIRRKSPPSRAAR